MKITLAGRLFYYLTSYRKEVIKKNLSVVYKKPLAKKEEKKFIQAVYSHYMTLLKEFFQMAYQFDKTITTPVELIGQENLEASFAKDKGIIILCGHLGNFQFAAAWTHHFLQYLGFFNVVVKSITNKNLEKMYLAGFLKSKIGLIACDKTGLSQMPKILKQNQAIFFAFDQNTKMKPKTAIVADFFGEDAATYRSLATLVRLTKTTVIPAHTYRLENGTHVIKYLPELEWIKADCKEEEIYLNTLNYNKVLEKMIMEQPTQWFWTHKRWKLDPDFYK